MLDGMVCGWERSRTGASMHWRNFCSSAAHPWTLYPDEAQHPVKYQRMLLFPCRGGRVPSTEVMAPRHGFTSGLFGRLTRSFGSGGRGRWVADFTAVEFCGFGTIAMGWVVGNGGLGEVVDSKAASMMEPIRKIAEPASTSTDHAVSVPTPIRQHGDHVRVFVMIFLSGSHGCLPIHRTPTRIPTTRCRRLPHSPSRNGMLQSHR